MSNLFSYHLSPETSPPTLVVPFGLWDRQLRVEGPGDQAHPGAWHNRRLADVLQHVGKVVMACTCACCSFPKQGGGNKELRSIIQLICSQSCMQITHPSPNRYTWVCGAAEQATATTRIHQPSHRLIFVLPTHGAHLLDTPDTLQKAWILPVEN